MPNYARTVITSEIKDKIQDSIWDLINSNEFNVRDYMEKDQLFIWSEGDDFRFLQRLSMLHPDIKFETKNWYESYRYIGTFHNTFKEGEFEEGEIKLDYHFEWVSPVDPQIKNSIEERFTLCFRKVDSVRMEPYISIDVHDFEKKTVRIKMNEIDHKAHTDEAIDYPIRYVGVKLGATVYVSIEFDINNN